MSTGRSYAGEAPEHRSARRRRQLLDAGLEVFGTTGYAKATVRQLCRQAKVADRSFYEEFDSTEDLLLAVYDECTDRLRQAVIGAVAGLDDLEMSAHDGLDAFFACVEADPRLARVVWFEIVGVSPRVEATYLERMNEFGELLFALVAERGVMRGVSAGDQQVILTAFVGGISLAVLKWVNDDFKPPRPRLVRPLVALMLASASLSDHSGIGRHQNR